MTRPNQKPQKCEDCGVVVEALKGVLTSTRDPDTLAVRHEVRHRPGECPEGREATVPQEPTWAVPAEGWTPGGHRARGVTLVRQRGRPHADAVLLGPAREYGEAPSLEDVARRTAVGRQWLGYWYLRGLRHRPAEVTMDDVDEMIGDADVAAMDAEVGR